MLGGLDAVFEGAPRIEDRRGIGTHEIKRRAPASFSELPMETGSVIAISILTT
jgi:hypothetical protein